MPLIFVRTRSWSIQLRRQDMPACNHEQVSVILLAVPGDVWVLAGLLRVSRGLLALREPVRCDEAARRVSRARR